MAMKQQWRQVLIVSGVTRAHTFHWPITNCLAVDAFDDDDSDTNTPSVSAVARVKTMKLDPFGDDKIPRTTGYFFGLLKELCDEEPMFKKFDECKDAVMVVETNDGECA